MELEERGMTMETYRVKVNVNGVVVLPPELCDRLNLVADDTLEIHVDTEGKLLLRTAERSVGPLADFFEDLILRDLRCEGCSGDQLKGRLLERKIQLSTILDRLAEEAHRAQTHKQTLPWRELPELKFANLEEEVGPYHVVVTARAEREMRKLAADVLREIPGVFANLEEDPHAYKRLRGPYYETYRVSVPREKLEHYRVIYTVFDAENLVTVFSLGERQGIYEHLKGLA